MSQRNPMNDRYQTDDNKGKTRKSAASAKPKTKAASSVRIQSTEKTPQQKKAAKKAERSKQQEVDRKYYNPPTAEYKKWRKIWWIMLIAAIVATALSFLVRSWIDNEAVSLVILGVGYAGIIGALVIDFTKIRKIRQEYQAEMQAKVSKEERAVQKKEKAAELAAKKAAEEKSQEAKDEEDSPISRRKGLFSFSGLRSGAERASKANKEAARQSENDTAQTAKDTVESGDKK